MSSSDFVNMNMADRLGFNPADLKIEPMAEFDFEAMRNDPAVWYIQIALRSGLDVEDLADEEKEFLHLIFGDEWRDEIMHSLEAMPEVPPAPDRAAAAAAMNSFLDKARAATSSRTA